MSNAVFVPFNHKPARVTQAAGSYTCPAGYYARVIVSINAQAYFSGVSGDIDPPNVVFDNANVARTLEFWLQAGDAISSSESTASNSSASSAGNYLIMGETTVTINVTESGGSLGQVSVTSARATVFGTVGASTGTFSIAGNADVDMHIEEYTIIS